MCNAAVPWCSKLNFYVFGMTRIYFCTESDSLSNVLKNILVFGFIYEIIELIRICIIMCAENYYNISLNYVIKCFDKERKL